MKNRRLLQIASGILSILMIFTVMSCGEGATSFEQGDLYGSEAGGTGSATTFFMEDGSTTYYITLEYQKGVRGTYANSTFTISEDFSWEIDDEGIITITYYKEASDKVWTNRVETTETLTAAYSEDGSLTITDSNNKVYEPDAEEDNELNAIIESYVDDRTYLDSSETEVLFFGESSGTFNSVSFDWEISDSKTKIYLHYEDGTYDIIEWTDGSGYYAVDQDGNKYTHNDIPLYIDDEDITKANLIGTWVRDDNGETLTLSSSNYGETNYWYIDDEYNLTVSGYDFYVTYNNDDIYEEVQIGTGSQYYTSTNANITNLYNKD